MITFKKLSQDLPYKIFMEKYEKSIDANQKNIEAISIASYSNELKEVNSRFVNLKFIIDKDFVFFSNYNSPKANEFNSHRQITALIYWNSINTQIRLKATIEKTSKNFNNDYFRQRNKHKNALAISSNQSIPINSYEDVEKNYHNALESNDLEECPEHWGGYSFTPYYFEFWEGHESRLNKRIAYIIKDHIWTQCILQP